MRFCEVHTQIDMKNHFNKQNNRQRGQVLIFVAMIFLTISMIVTMGAATPTARILGETSSLFQSKVSYVTAESSTEDVVYRLKNGISVNDDESVELNSITASTTITNVGSNKEITSYGDTNSIIRSTKVNLTTGTGAAFFYGVQAGNGGFYLENSSNVVGNVYSNGTVDGTGSSLITGGVVSAGPSGLVKDIYATQSVYSHTIQNVDTDANAYYVSITGSTVGGNSYPASPDQPEVDMPISDETIEDWKLAASDGGIISSPCPYTISGVTVTLGPVKINCDVTINGGADVTIGGYIWVNGSLSVSNSSNIRLDSSLGNQSSGFIVDSPLDRSSGSDVSLANSSTYYGTSDTNTNVIIVSMNNSAETGGSNTAILVKNSVEGPLLLYAPHGKIEIQNSVQVKEATGYLINLKNSAQVIYETGLANLLFQSGPGGGFSINSWGEVR